MPIDVKIKLVSPTAKMPTKGSPGSAAYDLYVDCPNSTYREWDGGIYNPEVNGIKIRPHETVIFDTGIATEIPSGYYAAVHVRSSIGIKQDLRLSNCTGIIDSDFRDTWKIALYNASNETRIIHHHDRVAQFIIAPVLDVNLVKVNQLNTENDRCGGIGSTGI